MQADAIVYTSNTGFTARYAALLGEKTGLPVYELGRAPAQPGTVLYLGWLCAGGIKGLDKALKRWPVSGVCAVGMGKPGENDMNAVAEAGRTGDRPLFYLQGGYAPQKLTGVYKLMMSVMGRAMSKKAAEDPNARDMVDAMTQGADWVSEAALVPVVQWLEQD